MKLLDRVAQFDVWDHWFRIENLNRYNSLTGQTLKSKIQNWRSDIKSPLPHDICWHEADIQQGDINRLYIISSDDWSDISQQSFLVRSISENLDSNFTINDSIRLSKDINRKISFLKSGSTFDTRFIAVSDSDSGPFTLIEGNRRAVALYSLKRLVGITIYLGISEQIRNFPWARYMYRSL